MAGDTASAARAEPRGGRVVPVYALTGGRTRSNDGADMPVETLVTATEAGGFAADLQLEYRATVELAASPVSIVEIGASLGVPVGVARVLVSDLVNAKYLVVHLPPRAHHRQAAVPPPRSSRGSWMVFVHADADRPHPAQGVDRRRVRGREDDLRPLPLGDPAAADRAGDDHRLGRRRRCRDGPGQAHHHGRDGLRADHRRRVADPLPVRHARARRGSGSCGTSWRAASVGAVVLVDLRRVDDCFPRDRLLREPRLAVRGRGQPLPGSDEHDSEAVREALALSGRLPGGLDGRAGHPVPARRR